MAGLLGLKVLKNYVYGDVPIGHDKNGRVSTTVRVNTGDPRVVAAMAPLVDLLTEIAHDSVRSADFEEQLESAAIAAAMSASADERSRVQRNHRRDLERVADRLHKAAGFASNPTDKNRFTQARDEVRGLITEGK